MTGHLFSSPNPLSFPRKRMAKKRGGRKRSPFSPLGGREILPPSASSHPPPQGEGGREGGRRQMDGPKEKGKKRSRVQGFFSLLAVAAVVAAGAKAKSLPYTLKCGTLKKRVAGKIASTGENLAKRSHPLSLSSESVAVAGHLRDQRSRRLVGPVGRSSVPFLSFQNRSHRWVGVVPYKWKRGEVGGKQRL